MAKFNRRKTVFPQVRNLAGGKAYSESAKLELIGILATSFGEDKFYRSSTETVERIKTLLAQNPQFAARAAVWARHVMGMRSISHVVAAELAAMVRQEPWLRKFITAVVRRPDDMTEIMAYYGFKYGKPIPNGLKRGLADAFAKFDEYGLAKYRGEGSEVKLVDVVNMVHPKPVAKNKVALKKLVAGKLSAPDTWEVLLTQAGQAGASPGDVAEKKRLAWRELLGNKQLGYFALLRNMRNIYQQADGETYRLALKQLADPEQIGKSLVMPFRFATAMEQLRELPDIANALELAAMISLRNIPEFPGRTAVVLDTSGSMRGKPLDVGSVFASAFEARGADLWLFSDSCKRLVRKRTSGILAGAEGIKALAQMECGGTNFHAIFEEMSRQGAAYDRIIILSDMQGWMPGGYGQSGGAPTATFTAYKRLTGCDPTVFSFNLNDMGSLMFPERKVICLAGWNEGVLRFMCELEQDPKALIAAVEATSFESMPAAEHPKPKRRAVGVRRASPPPKRKGLGSKPRRRAKLSSTEADRIYIKLPR